MKVTTETKKDERQLWLDSLKEGDEVAYRTMWGNGEYRITKVTKRTPTGRIVCGGITWKSDGWSMGTSYSSPGELVKVTEKIRHDVLKSHLVERFRNAKWHNVPLDTLVAMNELIQSSKATGNDQVAK